MEMVEAIQGFMAAAQSGAEIAVTVAILSSFVLIILPAIISLAKNYSK